MTDWKNSQEAIKEVRAAVDSAAILLAEEDDLKAQRKDLAKELKDEYGIAPKLFNDLAKASFQENFEDKKSDAEEFIESFEAVRAN